MRRKRFKHQAYILCHMFCGWQLHADYDRLLELRAGKLRINVLTKECSFNGSSIKPLSMASVLNTWFVNDLAGNNLRTEDIDEATLDVELDVTRDPKSRKGISAIKHEFHCEGTIRSGADLYIVRFEDLAGAQRIQCTT